MSLSSGIQGVEVVDRIRTQGVWSILCLVLAAITFYIVGTAVFKLPATHGDVSGIMDSVPKEALDYLKNEKPEAVDLLNQIVKGVPYYMAIPLVLVIVLAIAKFNTFICIGSGIVSAYLLGLPAGTTGKLSSRSEERRVGKECRSRWSPYH